MVLFIYPKFFFFCLQWTTLLISTGEKQGRKYQEAGISRYFLNCWAPVLEFDTLSVMSQKSQLRKFLVILSGKSFWIYMKSRHCKLIKFKDPYGETGKCRNVCYGNNSLKVHLERPVYEMREKGIIKSKRSNRTNKSWSWNVLFRVKKKNVSKMTFVPVWSNSTVSKVFVLHFQPKLQPSILYKPSKFMNCTTWTLLDMVQFKKINKRTSVSIIMIWAERNSLEKRFNSIYHSKCYLLYLRVFFFTSSFFFCVLHNLTFIV